MTNYERPTRERQLLLPAPPVKALKLTLVDPTQVMSKGQQRMLRKHCIELIPLITALPHVLEAWFSQSPKSEAIYFKIKLELREDDVGAKVITFSIRNHESFYAKRQHNFMVSNYYTIRDMKLDVMEWVERQIIDYYNRPETEGVVNGSEEISQPQDSDIRSAKFKCDTSRPEPDKLHDIGKRLKRKRSASGQHSSRLWATVQQDKERSAQDENVVD